MAGPAPTVAIVGLNALRRDLTRAIADNGPINAAFKQAGVEAATPIAGAARAAYPIGPTGRLAGDVRVTASRSGAAVRVGRASIRYAGFVDFGGHRRAPHESDRPYDSRGRYLFPNALQLAPRASNAYTTALTRSLDALPWTNNATASPESIHD